MIIETILGVVTGIGGSLVTGIMNYKTQKLKNTHDLATIKAESDAMVAEANANIQITQAQVEGEVEIADSKAYAISQREGNKDALKDAYVMKLFEVKSKFLRLFAVPTGVFLIFLLGIVDVFRKAMRPGLTAYLVGVTAWITYKAWIVLEATNIGATVLTPVQAAAIFTNVTNTVIYLTVSCVTWWFGDRRMAKFLMKMK
jgi:hypothetical protein